MILKDEKVVVVTIITPYSYVNISIQAFQKTEG
jgi:hypothetical protein